MNLNPNLSQHTHLSTHSEMTFDDAVEKLNIGYGDNNTDKGTAFEKLMKRFLLTYRMYKEKFKEVWLWKDFPYRKQISQGNDVGIDLVALTHEGEYWAIQCKFFGANTKIDKPHVDTFISTSMKMFTPKDASKPVPFEKLLWISTSDQWSSNADNARKNLRELFLTFRYSQLREAPVNWESLLKGKSGAGAQKKPKSLREHQQKALEAVVKGFQKKDRGKLIMACGTGKTITSLHIAQKMVEQLPNSNRMVLYLVPSLTLMSQTLCEWTDNCTIPMQAVCVCSDKGVSKREDATQLGPEDLALPAATNSDEIVRQWQKALKAAGRGKEGITVLFSTYQSIERVYEAQNKLRKALEAKGLERETAVAATIFDLIICDEAHRTTGIKIPKEEEVPFIKVHNNSFLKAHKRLYMTATPRLYKEDCKKKAKQRDIDIYSMDDESIYGEEFHRLGFGQAVEMGLLTDYKVLVLEANENQLSKDVQRFLMDNPEDDNAEIDIDDVSKMVGCLNALSKILVKSSQEIAKEDPEPMRRSVTFCRDIKDAKRIAKQFGRISEHLNNKRKESDIEQKLVSLSSDYVTGEMSTPERERKMSKLKEEFTDRYQSRMLCNVRCLSEGVDVPALDAVLFFSRRSSYVDVVQSVGRVMRKAEGKKFGYIIIPVAIPTDASPEEALDNNKEFDVVWEVLNALRAHDECFNAVVNAINLNTSKSKKIIFVPGQRDSGYPAEPSGSGELADENAPLTERQLQIQSRLELHVEKAQEFFYAKLVSKVGDKAYYGDWAIDVGRIAKETTEAIRTKLKDYADNSVERTAFDSFLAGLHESINPSISEADALDMLAQHIVSKPIFDSVVEGFQFAAKNSISQSMDNILSQLGNSRSEEDEKTMRRFEKDVKRRFEGIDNAQGRQHVIKELYNKFFSVAFKSMSEKLGIVYTPVEVVDFINHSVADLLQKEFGRQLGDEDVQILDPFTGTGTFVARMIGDDKLIPVEQLQNKYRKEIHANEILLLPYYIASVNIEQVYHDRIKPVVAFDKINGWGGEIALPNHSMNHFRASV